MTFLGTYLSQVSGSEEQQVVAGLDQVLGIISASRYGMVIDGVTDDSAAIQAAIDGKSGPLPAGTYAIASTLVLGNGSAAAISTTQNLCLSGAGGSGATSQEFGPSGFAGTVTLKWIGPADGTMIRINGPVVGSLKGLQLDGNNLAAVGIEDNHPLGGVVEDVVIRRVKQSFVRLRAREAAAQCYVAAGAARVYRNVRGFEPVAGTGFTALDVGNDTYSSGLDVARVTFIACEFTRPAGASNDTLTLRMCDNLTFIRCFFYGPSNSVGNCIAVRPPTGNAFFPEHVTFYDCAVTGAYYADAGWTINGVAARGAGLNFYSLNVGDNNQQVPAINGWNGFTTAMVPFGLQGAIAKLGTHITHTGTTSTTDLWTVAIPGYVLNTNRKLRVVASGTYTNSTGGAVNFGVYLGYGAQTAINGTLSIPTNANSGTWRLSVDISAYDGDTAKQNSVGKIEFFVAGSVAGVAGANVTGSPLGGGNNALTANSAISRNLILASTLGNASATFRVDSAVVELI